MATRSRFRTDAYNAREYADFSYTPSPTGSTITFESSFTYEGVPDTVEENDFIFDVSGVPIVQVGPWFKRHPDALEARMRQLIEGPYRDFLYHRIKSIYLPSISTHRVLVSEVKFSACNDTVTPDFKKRSRNGEIIMNPFSVEHVSLNCPIVNHGEDDTYVFAYIGLVDINSRQYISYSINISLVSNHYGLTESAAEQLSKALVLEQLDPENAINAAFSNITSAAFDLPVFIGERRELIELFSTNLRRLAGMIDSLRRGTLPVQRSSSSRSRRNPLQRRSLNSDAVASAWLEYRYAWTPLVHDIVSVLELLSDVNKYSPRQTFRSSRSQTDNGPFEPVITDLNYPFDSFAYSVAATFDANLKVGAGVVAQISPEMSVLRDFGLLNPLGVVWELVPYSFVIDRFVNISPLISQLGSTAEISTLGSWATLTSTTLCRGVIEASRSSGPAIDLEFTLSKTRADRLVNVRPKFSLNLDINVDLTFLTDAVALLWRFR